MPGQATEYGTDLALDAIFARATVNSGTRYLMLLTAAPSRSTDTVAEVTELSVAGYARQAFPVGSAPTRPDGTKSRQGNSAVITFGPFSADPANVPYAALVDSASGAGNISYVWTLDAAKDAAIGESITVAINAATADIT